MGFMLLLPPSNLRSPHVTRLQPKRSLHSPQREVVEEGLVLLTGMGWGKWAQEGLDVVLGDKV